MGKRYIWAPQAKAQLRAIDQQTALRILEALDRAISTGHGDIKQLQGTHPPQLRLRVGDYRVRFYSGKDWVEVLSVKNPREAYRYRPASSFRPGGPGHEASY